MGATETNNTNRDLANVPVVGVTGSADERLSVDESPESCRLACEAFGASEKPLHLLDAAEEALDSCVEARLGTEAVLWLDGAGLG